MIIVGTLRPSACRRLRRLRHRLDVPLHIVIRAAPDSVRDFCTVDSCLHNYHFYLAAISAVFHTGRFTTFVRTFRSDRTSKVVTIASFVSSRSPLCVAISREGGVANFCSHTVTSDHCVSNNVCYLKPDSVSALRQYVTDNVDHVHGCRHTLLTSNTRLVTCPFAGVVSISRDDSVTATRTFVGRR